MKKRIVLAVSLIAILACMLAVGVSAEDRGTIDSGKCGDNLTWTLYYDGELVISGTGNMWDYDNADNKAPWREYSDNLKTLTLTEGLTSIGDYAFQTCDEIYKDVKLPSSILQVGKYAFMGCLRMSFGNLPNNLEFIGEHAFSCCNFHDLIVPESVKYIGSAAFGCCTIYGNFEILNGTVTICSSAFESISFYVDNYCLNIPYSVVNIEDYAFSDLEFLDKVIVNSKDVRFGTNVFNGSHEDFTIYGYSNSTAETYAKENNHPFVALDIIDSGKCGDNLTWTLYDDGELVIDGTGDMWDYYRTYDSTLRKHVTNAPWGKYLTSITKLSLSDRLTSIGSNAFTGCSEFTGDLIIPTEVITIGKEAFYGCKGLDGDLIIGEKVVEIGESAFGLCESFKGELFIGNNVVTIEYGAFERCGFTGTLIIPNSVTTIGAVAFRNCSGFTGKLVLSDNLNEIQWGTFQNCSGFTGDLIIPDSVVSIGSQAFERCGFNGSIIFGKKVSKIHNSAFYECKELIGDLIFPDSLTDIGAYSFYGCAKLNDEVIIPKLVNLIGEYAFAYSSFIKAYIYSSEVVLKDNIFIRIYYENYTPFTIYGYSGSTAETYATANNYPFVPLDAFTLTGTLTTYLSVTDSVTLSLYAPDTTEPVYTITLAGDATEYKFDAVAPGSYRMTVEKNNHVTREYEVVVDDADVVLDVKIHPIGDLDGNGKVNSRDWNAVRDHINKSAVITDEYKFACADLDGNGKVNSRDWNRIRDHINKSNPLW